MHKSPPPAAERDALIALYNSTDGANWLDNTNWLGAAGTECNWFGVECSGGHVQRLYLSENQLSGSIPPELGNLSSLKYLELEFNQLSGSIPPELGSLSSLLILSLSANQLSGSIPPELGNLSRLQSFELDRNQLSGSIPPELGGLSSLVSLNLWENQLSGVIPPELGNLSSLGGLSLRANQLSGSIPPELGDLSSLRYLGLSSNQLSGVIPPELGDLSSLEGLSLSENNLSGSIPPELGNLSSLRYLYLDSNQLSGSIPPELGNLSSLEKLFLNSNQLSGSIPPELGNLSSLEKLFLNSNQLSGSIPAELENLWTLVTASGLDLRWNALHSDNASLIAFLNGKQDGGHWQSTQTIAPVNLSVDSVGDHTVWLSWDSVSYQRDPGGYSVFSAPRGSGVWTSGGWNQAKTDTTYPVTGLDPGTTYDLAVVSYTDPHPNNLNLVNSDFSHQVRATTASGGCAQPIIEVAGAHPITLSVTGSYDSYLWSTGEISSSIVVDPLIEQWYWVTVTSTGSCEATAATSVAPVIFSDLGFFADESAGAITVTVMRSGHTDVQVSVSYATEDLSAIAGIDYSAVSGTLTWANGEIADKTFVVPILDDGVAERTKLFRLTLDSPYGGATFGGQDTAVGVITNDDDAVGCTPDDDNLCLQDNRFKIETEWRDQRTGNHGLGTAVTDSGQTGFFWFFNSTNIELIVKMLDGREVSGAWWHFYGALSDVEYWIVATDTLTGDMNLYHNEPGDICGLGDTQAFPEGKSAAAHTESALVLPQKNLDLGPQVVSKFMSSAAGSCVADDDTMCLLDNRFQVEVGWMDQRTGNTGIGTAIPMTDNTGTFWFFNSENLELAVKVLDGGSINGKFWVFYGALSDVVYTITVTDTETGAVNQYVNEAGNICGLGDTSAFDEK